VGTSAGIRRAAGLGIVAAAAWSGVVAVTAAPSPAGLSAPASAPRAAVCVIEPDTVAEVGAQVIGVVEKLHAQRGDFVNAGQTLVSMRADLERANAGVADIRAKVDAEVQASRASLELATQKLKRAESLVSQAFVSEQAVQQAQAEHELARQKLAQAQGQQRIYAQERRVADAQLGLRSVKSPVTGVVVERYASLGERVEDKPLMRVAVIDPLRVELMLPTSMYGSLERGASISVVPELPGALPVAATVSQIDRVMDAASNTFRVRLRLPNPGGRLPAGLRCKAELPGATLAAAPAPATHAPATTPATVVRPVRPQAPAASQSSRSSTPAGPARLRLALALE
jgi:RND family efflux transporter MFP subunit